MIRRYFGGMLAAAAIAVCLPAATVLRQTGGQIAEAISPRPRRRVRASISSAPRYRARNERHRRGYRANRLTVSRRVRRRHRRQRKAA